MTHGYSQKENVMLNVKGEGFRFEDDDVQAFIERAEELGFELEETYDKNNDLITKIVIKDKKISTFILTLTLARCYQDSIIEFAKEEVSMSRNMSGFYKLINATSMFYLTPQANVPREQWPILPPKDIS